MSVCQCEAIEKLFDEKEATSSLEQAHRKGPRKTTRILLDGLRAAIDVGGRTLLDIGGGVGLIQQELFRSGLRSAVDVDASSAYLQAAQAEMDRLGLREKVTYFHGNFVDLASRIDPADMVTLDRVVCCYDELEALLDASAAKARSLYALVYPRDAWWMKLVGRLFNVVLRLRRERCRFFVHASAAVEAVMRRQGLSRILHRTAGLWQVALYAR
jgi:2-polyprenyl-3-methyl-5-hydroxy-6-metoxy-1,4-benzoquinol methylase